MRLDLLSALCAVGSEAVGEVDAAGCHGLGRHELECLALGDPLEEGLSASRDDRVHDQVELIEQAGVDEAGQQARATDHVDGFARLLPECTNLANVAYDPRRRPAWVGERL